MSRGKPIGNIKKHIITLDQNMCSFASFTINEIMEYMHDFVNDIIKKTNTDNVSNKTLANVFLFIDEKKIKGENKKEEMKKIITSYVIKNYKEIVKKASIFKNEEEDRKSKNHTKLRREILNVCNYLILINGMFDIMVSKTGYTLKLTKAHTK